ncbi:MAG: tetratricopeptide repeat protein [Gemmatimonadaceae bacterium]
MSDIKWMQQLIDASKRDQPALTVELGRLHLADNPDDRAALMLYGRALVDLARYDDARAAYEHALALTPTESQVRVLRALGLLCDARCDVREAEQHHRDAIAAAPNDASAYIFLGALLAKTGRLEEAERIHRRATDCTDGSIDEAFLNLGLVQRSRGDYVGALESLRRALTLDPSDQCAQDALSDIEALLFQCPPPEA